MQLKVDDTGLIQGYATVGKIDGGQDFGGVIPDDFEIKFKPGYYKIDGGVIVANPDYQEPALGLTGPSAEMQAINALGLVVAQMQAKEDSSNV